MTIALIATGFGRAGLLFRRRRLPQVSPYAKGNLLAEARQLHRRGYTVAAVFQARVAVERRLREMCFSHPKWGAYKSLACKGITRYRQFLLSVGVIRTQLCVELGIFSKKVNSVCHGESSITRLQSFKIMRHAAVLLSMLERGSV